MQPFTAAPHGDVLVLLIQVAVLLCAARGLGEVAQRLGQPSVVGEILAGIVLGPSLLSGLAPGLGAWIVPHTALQGHLLEVVSLIGAMLLLLVTGLETDLTLIRRHARTALGVSAGGILVTFSTGFLLGQLLPDDLLARPDQRMVFALFVATAMSISAIPVIAKVLMDLNLMRRDIGQTIIAAGMSDDTTGWVLLSIVAGLAGGAAVTVGGIVQAVGSVVAFMALSFTAGRWLMKRALDFVQDEVTSADRLLTLVVVFTFAWGALSQALHLEAVLGAFVVGVIFGQLPRLPNEVRGRLESVTLAVFAPIFFAVAGLKVHIAGLFEPRLMMVALAVIAVATGGKVVGTYLGARLIGRRDHWTALAFGAGLNARGAMEIIVATIGLKLGILGPDMFSIIVLMAMTTSLMAPPALRWVLRHIEPDDAELRRLKQEALTAGSRVAQIHRVLVPLRRRRDGGVGLQWIEARLLERMGHGGGLSLTLMSVCPPGEREVSQAWIDQAGARFTGGEQVRKVVEGEEVAGPVLEEAAKHYDLLLLGAPERDSGPEVLFTSVVDELVRGAPCLTMVVKAGQPDADWAPRRILVPTDGTAAARHAAEIGFALAAPGDAEVTILHVVMHAADAYRRGGRVDRTHELGIGYQIVEELGTLGDSLGVRTRLAVQAGAAAEAVILEVARQRAIDLIILGTAVRGAHRLFVGSRVERVLNAAPCPVVVVTAP